MPYHVAHIYSETFAKLSTMYQEQKVVLTKEHLREFPSANC